MKITKKSVKETILLNIQDDKNRIEEHEQVKTILTPAEGKPINKKTLSEKVLNGLKFEYRYGMFHIEGKFRHLIGYDNNPFINIDSFINFDACNGTAAAARVKQNENILNDSVKFDLLVKTFAEIEKHYECLKAKVKEIDTLKFDSFNFPTHYDILRIVNPDQEQKEIKLSNFKYL